MTVQRKQIAKGSQLLISTVGGVLAAYGRIETIDLPPEDFETFDVPELNPTDDAGASVLDDPVELGDEILGEAEFVHYWDPMHADATQLSTWRNAKTELQFAFDSPHASGAARITFRGKIKTLAPEQVAKKNYLKRKVTVIRTSAVTVAAKP